MPSASAPPPETEPPSKGDLTRAFLIETGYRLFARQGYHGTSMRRIAQEAGLAPSAIYNHFDGKEALFAAVLEAYHPYRQVLQALQEAAGDTVDDLVRDAARRTREVITHSEASLLPLAFIELVEFQGRHIARIVEMVYPDLAEFTQRLAAQHAELRPVPVPVAVRTFIGLVLAYVASEVVVSSTPVLQAMDFDWFDGMLDIYLHGLVARPPADERR